MYNILIAGAAGHGIETMTTILEYILNRNGLWVFTVKDLMSRVRGGHNFSLLSVSENPIQSHSYNVDLLVALNEESYVLHKDKVKKTGTILLDISNANSEDQVQTIDYNGIAKKHANPKLISAIAAGAVVKIIGESPDNLAGSLSKIFGEKLLDVNMQAFNDGYHAVETKFPTMERAEGNHIVLSGNRATALGALAAGVTFYSAYPMSPATSIMEYLNQYASEYAVMVEQAEDEIAAINMALGASFTGAKAMTGSSGGGFSLMVEAIGFSGIAEIPIVIAEVQRPGPATGLPTRTEQSDLSFVISASHGEFPRMVISIKNIEDAFYQTKRAFDMAEKYQIPVILLSDQYISDSIQSVPMFDFQKLSVVQDISVADHEPVGENNIYKRYCASETGVSKMLYPGETDYLVAADSDEHDEYGKITESADVRKKMMDKRLRKMAFIRDDLIEPEYVGAAKCEILLVAFGSLYGPVKEAVQRMAQDGTSVGALLFGDVYPLPTKKLRELGKTAKQIIAVEQNATAQLKQLIQKETLLEIKHEILKYDGRQLSADEIIANVQALR